jgi:hypothetical protein
MAEQRNRYLARSRSRRDLGAAPGDATLQSPDSWKKRRYSGVHSLEKEEPSKLEEQDQPRARSTGLAAAITKVGEAAVGTLVAESSSGITVWRVAGRYVARGVSAETAALWDAVEEENETAAADGRRRSSAQGEELPRVCVAAADFEQGEHVEVGTGGVGALAASKGRRPGRSGRGHQSARNARRQCSVVPTNPKREQYVEASAGGRATGVPAKQQTEQTITDDDVLRRCEEEGIVVGADDWNLFRVFCGRQANRGDQSG